jgi:hypothetical protein
MIYNTKVYLKSICSPLDSSYNAVISQSYMIDTLIDILYNLKACLPLTIASANLTFIFGAIFTTTLIYCTGITLWFFIFSVFFFSALIGLILLYRANHWFLPLLEESEIYDVNLKKEINYTVYTGTLLVFSILCFGLSLFTFFYTLFSLKKISRLRTLLKLSAVFI